MIERKPIVADDGWKSLADLAKVVPLDKLHASAIAKLTTLQTVVDGAAKAPVVCPRADVEKLVVAPTQTLPDFNYPQFTYGIEINGPWVNEDKLRSLLESIMAANVVVVQKTLEVRAADVDVSSRTFTSGTAQAMALIVAVSPPRVLCATKVTAFNDDKATIQVTASGEQWSNSTSQDLSTNLDKAVLEGAAALIKNAK